MEEFINDLKLRLEEDPNLTFEIPVSVSFKTQQEIDEMFDEPNSQDDCTDDIKS